MRSVYQPRKLRKDLSIQQVGEETLIYNERIHQAFCLNQISSAVWAHCDGTQSVEQIAAALCSELAQPVTEETVLLALAQMEENGLLESATESHSEVSHAAYSPIFSRRSLMATLGAGAVMMLPAPAIATVMAPKPFAGSGCVDGPCSVDPGQVDGTLPGLHRARRIVRQAGGRQ
jgi:hypothetical protein